VPLWCHPRPRNDDERFFISRVLAFFAASDGIVNENHDISHLETNLSLIRADLKMRTVSSSSGKSEIEELA
jgi:hypothetical protein